MSLSISNSVTNAFHHSKTFIVSNAVQWFGHLVAFLRIAKNYLRDPRLASCAVFAINFAILEIALRISQIVKLILPKETALQDNVQFACQLILAGSLVLAANIGFTKVTGITLHPLVIIALVIGTLVVKIQLEGQIAKKSID